MRREPWADLGDLFRLLPDWSVSRVLERAPVHWRQTREQPDAQQRLAADPFLATVRALDKHHAHT